VSCCAVLCCAVLCCAVLCCAVLQDDMERRSYRMKQEALAPVLVNAAGLSKENPEAKRAINW